MVKHLKEPCKLKENILGKALRSYHVLFGTEAGMLALPLSASWAESLCGPVLPSKETHVIRMERNGGWGMIMSSPAFEPLFRNFPHAVKKGDPGGQMVGPGALGRTQFSPGHPVCLP